MAGSELLRPRLDHGLIERACAPAEVALILHDDGQVGLRDQRSRVVGYELRRLRLDHLLFECPPTREVTQVLQDVGQVAS